MTNRGESLAWRECSILRFLLSPSIARDICRVLTKSLVVLYWFLRKNFLAHVLPKAEGIGQRRKT